MLRIKRFDTGSRIRRLRHTNICLKYLTFKFVSTINSLYCYNISTTYCKLPKKLPKRQHASRDWYCILDKIIVGSYHGILRIFMPRTAEFKAEDLMLEIQMTQPILQVEAGHFVSLV